jgi:predicted dinucleotide-binding enzyme
MRIGILGSGLMGGLGTIFARAGHEVVFSYARSNNRLNSLVREAQGNARAGTPGEAAKNADALVLAVRWSRIDDVLKQAGDLSSKVILTCCLPMDVDNSYVGSRRAREESSTRPCSACLQHSSQRSASRSI